MCGEFEPRNPPRVHGVPVIYHVRNIIKDREDSTRPYHRLGFNLILKIIVSPMINIKDHFIHLPEHQLLICNLHKYALQPNGIDRHLHDYHTLPSMIRIELTRLVAGLILRGSNDFIIPRESISILIYLPIPIPGFRYNQCNFLSKSENGIRNHYRETHRQDHSIRGILYSTSYLPSL